MHKLEELQPNTPVRTACLAATRRNCDARFSCSSYREYALGSSAPTERKFPDYYNSLGAEADREDFVDAAWELVKPLADPDEYKD